MIFIRKCNHCECYTESEIITDDGEPYIICNHCGFLMDIPSEALAEIQQG